MTNFSVSLWKRMFLILDILYILQEISLIYLFNMHFEGHIMVKNSVTGDQGIHSVANTFMASTMISVLSKFRSRKLQVISIFVFKIFLQFNN